MSKPLSQITQADLLEAMAIDGHGVKYVHSFGSDVAGDIFMKYTASDGKRNHARFMIENTGEISMGVAEVKSGKHAPLEWVTFGLMFYVYLKQAGYSLPALD